MLIFLDETPLSNFWISTLFVGSFLALFAVGQFLIVRNQRRMRRERVDDSSATFAAEFAQTSCRPEAISLVFAEMSKDRGHPVRRFDVLEEFLGFLPEDLEDMLIEHCRKLGVPDVMKSEYVQHFPLRTVDDYVQFLSKVIEGEE